MSDIFALDKNNDLPPDKKKLLVEALGEFCVAEELRRVRPCLKMTLIIT